MNETNLRQIIVEAVRHALKEGYNKRTTTEEKVKQLGEKYAYCTLTNKEIAEQSSIEMAQWKNDQFLKLIKEELHGYISYSDNFTEEDYHSFINTIKSMLRED